MKLIFAGVNGEGIAAENYLFNCTRDIKCQKPFYVPVNSIADIILYADIPIGTITNIQFSVYGCDASGEQLDSGDAPSCNFGYGALPDGSGKNFAVFTGFTSAADLSIFYFKIIITVSGVDYVYFSQQYEIEKCVSLSYMEGCYGENDNPETMFDCNGIYYGAVTTGTAGLKYIHKAFVRYGKVLEQNNKLTFTLFNSRQNYKTVLTKEMVYEFETVPTFYKDHLISIFARGNVYVDTVLYTMAEESEVVRDKDSSLWTMDIALKGICKQFFGCNTSACAPIPAPTCTNFSSIAYDEETGIVTLTGPAFLPGEHGHYILKLADVIISEADFTTNTIDLSAFALDTENCYDLEIDKFCLCIDDPDIKHFGIGNCADGECTCEIEIIDVTTEITA